MTLDLPKPAEDVISAPLLACILIGGQSQRMSTPKQLISCPEGVTWLERTVAIARRVTSQVDLAGRGEIPSSLKDLPHLADVPGIKGPLAGLLALMRWQLNAGYLLLACDLPGLTIEALQWLISYRSSGVIAILPSIKPNTIEPLTAIYEGTIHSVLESRAKSGIWGFQSLQEERGVITPTPPTQLVPAWQNVNTPDEKKDYENVVHLS
jgi:molybdopterin-guanine dinucleotide biosynthesis protein A